MKVVVVFYRNFWWKFVNNGSSSMDTLRVFRLGMNFASTTSFLEMRKLNVLIIVDNWSNFEFLGGIRHEYDV